MLPYFLEGYSKFLKSADLSTKGPTFLQTFQDVGFNISYGFLSREFHTNGRKLWLKPIHFYVIRIQTLR